MSVPPHPEPWVNVTTEWLRLLEARGESAYAAVNGEDVLDIPSRCVSGRSGTHGNLFSGMINLRTGQLRVDCANDPGFWLVIDLSKVPGFAHAPGGAGAAAAQREFEAAAGAEDEEGEEEGEEEAE